MILPTMEAFTTSCSPARRAKSAMISSVALPKVAFINPPSAGPTRSDSSSVASPINPANGTMASAAVKKISRSGRCNSSSAMLTGMNSNSQFNARSRIKRGKLKWPV